MARRSGLGRGLGSLIPTEAIGQRGSALQEVPVGSIRANALQPRSHFDEEAMASLADSIREVGVLQPVLVRRSEEGGYEIASLAARFTERTNELASVRSTADTQTRWILSPLMREDLKKEGVDFRSASRRSM